MDGSDPVFICHEKYGSDISVIEVYIQSSLESSENWSFLKTYFKVQFLPVEGDDHEGKTSKNQIKKQAQNFFERMKFERPENVFYLLEQNQKWNLLDNHFNCLSIDFDEDHLNYLRKSSGKKEVFFKALGAKTQRVLDITGGLAIDSVFLARNGYQVETVERHPLVYFMLSQAQKKSSDSLVQAIKFHFSEAKNFLYENKEQIKNFDAIYFDPMYPEKGKTALSRQEMQLFKFLVGKDEDASEILAILRTLGPRIVVKRPIHGVALDEKKVHEFTGKTVRFDIY